VPDTSHSTEQTWTKIMAAAKSGDFIPVLGFDVAASIDYADAVPMGDFNDDDDPEQGPSVQFVEEARIEAQLRAIGEILQALPEDDSHWEEAAGPYLNPLTDQWAHGCSTGRTDSEPPCGPLLNLQVALVSTAARMTQVWATALRDSPTSAGTTWLSRSVPTAEAVDTFDSLRVCLDKAHELTLLKPAPGSLRNRDVNYIYVKLLRLTKDVVDDRKVFWKKDDADNFADRHKTWMRTTGRQVDCGWSLDSDIPTPRRTTDSGIRLAHLIWLENLLRFTLLSQTRAHRTRSDIAFALSLNDPGIDIPKMPADPFEIGLLYERHEAREATELARLMKYCSTSNEGERRRPGTFHTALARIMRFYESKPRADGSKRIPIMLVLGADLEMESALEQEYDRYQVLVPVLLPKDGRTAGWGRSEEDEPDGDEVQSDKSWLMGTFSRRDEGFVGEWEVIGSSAAWQERGPLVIKLFGSPAHDLPVIGEISGDTSLYDIGRTPIHHVVLDEMEMIDAIVHTRDEMERLEGLYDRFASSMMFCFGYDAISWGDRAPYLVVSAIRSNAEKRGAVWGEAEDGSFPGIVALTRRDDPFARSVWQRLQVERILDEQALKGITGLIVREASRCQ
jgi:hypothetical protein